MEIDLNNVDYCNVIEAILFASSESVALSSLAYAIGTSSDTAKLFLDKLTAKYSEEKRGIQIIESNGSYRMHTNQLYFEYINKVYQKPQKKPLTQPLIETLTIIAFKQPITKAQIEEIRGVNADHAVNKLCELMLVCECGRLDAPGRPITFGTTDEFLQHFGLKDLGELEKIKEVTEVYEQETLK